MDRVCCDCHLFHWLVNTARVLAFPQKPYSVAGLHMAVEMLYPFVETKVAVVLMCPLVVTVHGVSSSPLLPNQCNQCKINSVDRTHQVLPIFWTKYPSESIVKILNWLGFYNMGIVQAPDYSNRSNKKYCRISKNEWNCWVRKTSTLTISISFCFTLVFVAVVVALLLSLLLQYVECDFNRFSWILCRCFECLVMFQAVSTQRQMR